MPAIRRGVRGRLGQTRRFRIVLVDLADSGLAGQGDWRVRTRRIRSIGTG